MKRLLGDQIMDMVREAGLSAIKVSQALSPPMTSTTVARWIKKLNVGKLADEDWYKLGRALKRLGIDAGHIRPVRKPQLHSYPTELLPLLELFDAEQRAALYKILTAEEEAVEVFRLFLKQLLGK